MSLGELTRPITIYWDLTPTPPLPPDYNLICNQIKEAKPLQLHLLDCNPGNTSLKIVSFFKGAPLAVILTTNPVVLSTTLLDNLHDSGLKGLLLKVSSYAELAEAKSVKDAIANRIATGIAFQVNRENWKELPQVVNYCLEQGVGSLTLPMQRLYGSEPILQMTAGEQALLTQSLKQVTFDSLRLTIHDPFLWRAFNPGTPFPGNGCQAANTMLAITPDGTVYPCPALPIPLGKLPESTLAQVISSINKKDLRQSLRQPPKDCVACIEVSHCLGGCRGRTYIKEGELSAVDPACPVK